MSGILAYTTEVSAPKSIGEIIGLLSQAKASAIMQEFDGAGNVTAINFRIQTQFGLMTFRMPANLLAVDACLKQQWRNGTIPRRYANDSQHSRRVAWRILRHWLEAQLALITVGLAKVEEVFLPYAQDADGKTVFEKLEAEKFTGLALPAPGQSALATPMTDPNHPWAVNVSGTWCKTCDSASRIDAIRASVDIAWLKKVKRPEFTDQITARKAAERRLRILARATR